MFYKSSKGSNVLAAAWVWAAVAAAAAAEPKEFPLAKPISVRLPFGQLSYQPGDKQLSLASLDGAVASIPIPFLAGANVAGQARILVDDFDFDGSPDLMVPISMGYGGVNWFYQLHRFDAAALRLREPDREEFCNPAAEPGEHIVAVPCKNGPAWYANAYKFAAGRPYPYRSNELVEVRGFAGADAPVFLQRELDPAGRLVEVKVVEAGETSKPAVRKIAQARVYLHDAASDGARTAAYVVKDDVVELLDIVNQGEQQWLKVAYSSARAGRLVKWIRLEE